MTNEVVPVRLQVIRWLELSAGLGHRHRGRVELDLVEGGIDRLCIGIRYGKGKAACLRRPGSRGPLRKRSAKGGRARGKIGLQHTVTARSSLLHEAHAIDSANC